ncbi:Transcription initiation factor IIF subunit beta [Apiospora arundinis]|uniref:Transcription initiation factor IIF beta subunit-domain-containing protein n=1 Tax=Apiospora arundinis TaxID=335852 RepID=A0ABR2J7D4_9PEZI
MASSVKPEPGVKPEPEDASASPAVMSDDELYEDAGDLEFYDSTAPNDPNGNLFLTHVPKYLYDQWAQLKDDEEIEVGRVRRWVETDKNGQKRERMAMLLDLQNPVHQTIPKEYNFEERDSNLLNTFMFTEQDLPGFKSKSQGANSNIPHHLRNRQQNNNNNNNNNNKQEGGRKRYQPYYRKAIPKKTVLAGRFKTELNCQPADTMETRHILAMRASDALKPRATTSMMSGMSGTRAMTKNILNAGAAPAGGRTGGFIQTAKTKEKARKSQPERAARLDKGPLIDALCACFRKWRYWTMKAFKQQLNQPEAWLRENLETIATLHKSGAFANHWELNDVYRDIVSSSGDIAQAGTAPGDLGGDDSELDGDDDDENIQMEDVPAIS